MALSKIKDSERFEFENAQELKDFLNQFHSTDLRGIPFTNTALGYLVLHWETEVLSDGSHVNNLRVST